jgi:probable O-glycosylation ligase (exosortase A-associated)
VARSLYLCLVYGAFLCAGLVAPFALGLGYVWVDTFTPQYVAYSLLSEFPVSLVMAVATLLAYFAADRKSPPRINAVTVLTLLMAAWVTFTTFNNPVAPEAALLKWNWAVKTILFSAFMPLLFRSRVQIEAFLLVYIFSLMGELLPFAFKTLLSGGSYGTSYGLTGGNTGLAEGSHLTTVAMLVVPILLFLRRHCVILPHTRAVGLMFLGLAFACFPAAIGTYERTALIGMVVVVIGLWLRLRRRILYGAVGGAVMAVAIAYGIAANSSWAQRMMTIGQYSQDSSAYTRILVWRWTLDFVHDHPLGGGFNSFYVNTITLPATADNPEPIVQHGRAFHSVFFEMLGEHGWPGLALFIVLFAIAFLSLHRTAARAGRLPGMEWCIDLARALQISLVVPLACGAFIGIAFQPEIYYLFALSVMLQHQVAEVARRARPEQAVQLFDPETGLFEARPA